MKIAIVTPTFPPYAGGIGNVALFNARELVKLGHQVTVFTPMYKQTTEEIKDLEIKRIKPLFKYGNAAFVPALGKLLRGYDIIHLHYPFFGGAEIVWLHKRKLKKLGAKIVLHYHMDVVGEGIFKTIFKIHKIFCLPKIVKMSDKIIFTSMDYGKNSDISAWLEKYSQKFIEVPNGVDTKNFTPESKDSELLKKYDISPEDRVIVFVGGLDKAHYFKGVEYLIQAVSQLRQKEYKTKLIVVGKGELQKEYESLASQLRLSFNVSFGGYVPNEDLPKYYNLADVVVLPSVDKSEAFGMTLIEGMSCAKPVIATNLPGVRSVVTEKMDGLLVEPKNPNDLASKLNYFLSNPSEAFNFGKAGLRKAKLKYDWSIIGQKLDELYRNLNEKNK